MRLRNFTLYSETVELRHEVRTESLEGFDEPLNIRSLKTALRNGRKITEADYFLKLNEGL